MAKRKKSSPTKYPAIVVILVVVMLFVSWGVTGEKPEILQALQYEIFGESFGEDEALSIFFIDVGQGDSTLVGCNGRYILVDAGENGCGKDIMSHLKRMGITKLDVVIGTHPHSDHIGGLDYVINHVDVENIYLPNKAADTKTYRDVLDAVEDTGNRVIIPEVGDILMLGEMTMTFLHPSSEETFNNENNYSIVVRVENEYGSVLLTGDAETEVEEIMLEDALIEPVDVLKVGHHGSSTSNSETFIKAVDPRLAIISCGANNDYGHPHRETIALLSKYEIPYCRTDEEGDIRVIMDEEGLFKR